MTALPVVTVEFETWYHAEYPRLVNSLAMVLGNRAVAADAAAEGFTRALARWSRVRRMEYPSAWVYRVALNHARKQLQRAGRERDTLRNQTWANPPAAAPIEGDHELWAAVAALPDRMRSAVVLRYVADLTEPAIAEAMNVRRGTIATMLRRAHEQLALELDHRSPAATSQELSNAFPN